MLTDYQYSVTDGLDSKFAIKSSSVYSGVANYCIRVSAYRPLSAFITQEINDIPKTSDSYAAATTNPSPNINPNRYQWRSNGVGRVGKVQGAQVPAKN